MLVRIISLAFFLSLLTLAPAHSAVFDIPSGNVTALIAAINVANANDESNTINLAPGIYTLAAIDNNQSAGSGNGLPVISSAMTIKGESAETTIIEREGGARESPLETNPTVPRFGILAVAAKGILTIDGMTIRGGRHFLRGGGIANAGILTIHRSMIEHNSGLAGGGGIYNGGTLVVSTTHIRENFAHDGGGILNFGKATIIDSSIVQNRGDSVGGFFNEASGTATIRNSTISDNHVIGSTGGISNHGVMMITNSTIANNSAPSPSGVAVSGLGPLTIINSTISGNHGVIGPASSVSGAEITMQNTIVALNDLRDCPPTSLGNNLFGNPTGCSTALHPTDLTGEPGLGTFIDSGAPGSGRFPLLPSSQAIDAGNETVCAATDQLETPRRGRCDIGAVEFYPIINDLVALANMKMDFDPTPVPDGPAGTFRITAEFTNTSNQTITSPFVEVVDLSGGNLLLNADGGAGRIGARLRPTDVTIFQPGTTHTFEFLIGLQMQEPFTFFVNMLGESLSDPSIRTIRVNAVIDGRSQLILRGNTAQWRHFDFAAPGRLDFKNVPTIVNKIEWFPTWPDQPDRENRDCDGCLSEIFTGVNPPLTSENTIVSLRKIQARNNVSIVQLPTADNNFTLIIEFDDNPPSGDDTYIVDIDFVTDQQHGMKEMAAR